MFFAAAKRISATLLVRSSTHAALAFCLPSQTLSSFAPLPAQQQQHLRSTAATATTTEAAHSSRGNEALLRRYSSRVSSMSAEARPSEAVPAPKCVVAACQILCGGDKAVNTATAEKAVAEAAAAGAQVRRLLHAGDTWCSNVVCYCSCDIIPGKSGYAYCYSSMLVYLTEYVMGCSFSRIRMQTRKAKGKRHTWYFEVQLNIQLNIAHVGRSTLQIAQIIPLICSICASSAASTGSDLPGVCSCYYACAWVCKHIVR